MLSKTMEKNYNDKGVGTKKSEMLMSMKTSVTISTIIVLYFSLLEWTVMWTLEPAEYCAILIILIQ